MRSIAFKNTALFKRGIWLSAAALIVFVAAPAAVSGSLWRDPRPTAIAVGILCVALGYFFWRTQIPRLADSVVDRGDRLEARRGKTEESIAMSNIESVQVLSSGGFHRISIRLRQASKFGMRLDFLPQASLWSNLPAIEQLARDLDGRKS